jgi:glycosyltransferase involved in cell wall biosynthesis
MMNSLNAETSYKRAQKAFKEGRYADAQAHAKKAAAAIMSDIRVTQFGPQPKAAEVSIVVVIHQWSKDTESTLSLIAPLSQTCELVIVDNGANLRAESVGIKVPSFILVNIQFNYGCCGGRNVGATISSGKVVVFVDDDGDLDDGSIEALTSALTAHGCIAARGRVLPKTADGLVAGHYDLGHLIAFAPPMTEGISAWRRSTFLEEGGFDSLLSGHEGLLLYAKMFRYHGPEAFIYVPTAILRHDYAKNRAHLSKKKSTQEAMLKYAEFVAPNIRSIKGLPVKPFHDYRVAYLRSLILERKPYGPLVKKNRLSVLTVYDGSPSDLDDFYRGISRQIFHDFELVLVAFGKPDATVLDRLTARDKRIRLITSECETRTSALNLAIEAANEDICVIAEASDISLPKRLEETACFFQDHSEFGCLSFHRFSDSAVFRNTGPSVNPSVRIRARSLLGMPCEFSCLAFRRSHFPLRFDQTLRDGAECDWIHRNLRARRGLDGIILPDNMVYRGDGQDSRPSLVALTAERHCSIKAQRGLTGDSSEQSDRLARILGGWEKFSSREIRDIEDHVLLLLRENMRKNAFDHDQLESYLFSVLYNLKTDLLVGNQQKVRDSLQALKERNQLLESRFDKLFFLRRLYKVIETMLRRPDQKPR